MVLWLPGPVSNRQLTAYHEAGHVVADFLDNEFAEWVTIVPGQDYVGRVLGSYVSDEYDLGQMSPDAPQVLMDSYLWEARRFLAGQLAESVRIAQSRNHVTMASALYAFAECSDTEPDRTHTIAIARRLCGNETEVKAWVQERAREVVDLFLHRRLLWTAVATIASALLEHAEFDGLHARWLYAQVMAERSALDIRVEFARRLVTNPGWRAEFLRSDAVPQSGRSPQAASER